MQALASGAVPATATGCRRLARSAGLHTSIRYKPQAVQAGGQAAAPATAQMMAVQQAPGTPPASPPPEELIFYTHVLCPYAERVWLVLLEKARWQTAWSMHLNTTGCGCGTKGGGGRGD